MLRFRESNLVILGDGDGPSFGICDATIWSARVRYFTIRFILYIMIFGDALLSRLVSSVLTDARCVLAYIILFFDSFSSFQKEWSRSHEEPREPFYSPVVNHFINLRRIMPQVKRRPEVNVSSAPSISRHIPSYLFLPTSSSTSHKHYQDEEKRCYLESIRIRAK